MKPLVLLLSALMVSGCAMLARSTARTQTVHFVTTPPGALLTIEGRRPPTVAERSDYRTTCLTPCALALARSAEPARYELRLTGYQWYAGQLTPHDDVSAAIIAPLLVDLALLLPYLIFDRPAAVLYGWPEAVEVILPPVGSALPPTVTVVPR